MKHHFGRLCVFLFAGLLGGCLEFEEQTMSYRYDKATDELRIFQVYRGIHGADAEGAENVPLSDREVQQLDSVIEGGRTFFFDNWITTYDREDLLGELEKLQDPAHLQDSGIEAVDVPAMENLLDLLVANVRIINGPFYLGADGKLCATQSITVREWSQVVTGINELKPMLLRNAADEDDASPADRRAIAKFSKDADATLLRVAGNVLISQWPMSRASYDSKFGDKSEDPSDVEEIRDAGIRIEWKDGVVTFTLGKKDDAITELTLDSGKTPYTPNAVAPARGRQLIKDDFDPKAAAQVFLLRKEGD